MKWRGFSLIEVVVATALVVTTVGAVFAVASTTTRLTVLAQDRLIASQLSREGLEAARQIRDANFVVSDTKVCNSLNLCKDWWDGLQAPGKPAGIYKLDSQSAVFALVPLGNGSTSALTGNESCDFLPRSIGANLPPQNFCRRIFIEPIAQQANGEEQQAIRIRSQVAWLGYGRNAFRPINVTNENSCPAPKDPGATEWCTEQVTILTNWRPAL